MTRRSDRLTRIEERLEGIDVALDFLRQKIDAVLARLVLMDDRTAALAETIREVMAARAEHDAGVAADVKAARNAAEFTLGGVQSLVAVHNAQAREAAVKPAPEVPVPAPPAVPAVEGKPAAKTRGSRL